ncbi:MAG: N-6 DNA methylase, partial [Acidimicrobiales bacterium]
MLRAYLDAVRAWAGAARLEAAPAAAAFVEVVLAAHGRAGERLDVALLERLPEAARALASPPAPPAELARPELLGQVYEALLEPTGRRRRGAYFTPPAAAAGLVRAALACWTAPADGAASPAPAVCDLTCGGGVFLLAAAEALAASATSPLDAAARVRGVDVDPGACEVAAASLALWARLRGASLPGASRAGAAAVRCADAFTLHGAQFDLVVGNPPFLNQLQRGTARAPEQAAVLARRFGGAARGYVDSSALFLLAALDLVRAGGVVALVQPESLLAAAHAEGVRAALLERAGLHGLWLAGEAVFDAAVRVCAPVLVLAGGAAPPAAGLLRWTGCEVTPAPPLALDAHALA